MALLPYNRDQTANAERVGQVWSGDDKVLTVESRIDLTPYLYPDLTTQVKSNVDLDTSLPLSLFQYSNGAAASIKGELTYTGVAQKTSSFPIVDMRSFTEILKPYSRSGSFTTIIRIDPDPVAAFFDSISWAGGITRDGSYNLLDLNMYSNLQLTSVLNQNDLLYINILYFAY